MLSNRSGLLGLYSGDLYLGAYIRVGLYLEWGVRLLSIIYYVVGLYSGGGGLKGRRGLWYYTVFGISYNY
jgi:hypothetical protein